MEGASGISSTSKSQDNFDLNSSEWEKQLSASDNNGWRNSEVNANDPQSIVTETGEFKPEVQKVLGNFIGNMGIEMFKTQNPAQKISMGDDE